jgi:hypothetical protein
MPTSEQMRRVVAAVHGGETLATTGVVREPTLRNFLRLNPRLGSRLKVQSHENAVRKCAREGRPPRWRTSLKRSVPLLNGLMIALGALGAATATSPADLLLNLIGCL